MSGFKNEFFATAALMALFCAMAIDHSLAQPGSLTTTEKHRVILYGTALDPQAQISESQQLAKSLASPVSPNWRAKGDQRRTYKFPGTEVEMPYRIYVPSTWDGKSKLPLVVFLHGGGSDENLYLEANDKQLLKLAEKNGYLLVSPLGYSRTGAYGTCLRLPYTGKRTRSRTQREGRY
jgi:acetyl esterase/lipase